MNPSFTGQIFWINNDANYRVIDPMAFELTFTRIEEIILEDNFIQFRIPKINQLEKSYFITLVADDHGNMFRHNGDDLQITGELYYDEKRDKIIVSGNWIEDSFSFTWFAKLKKVD